MANLNKGTTKRNVERCKVTYDLKRKHQRKCYHSNASRALLSRSAKASLSAYKRIYNEEEYDINLMMDGLRKIVKLANS